MTSSGTSPPSSTYGRARRPSSVSPSMFRRRAAPVERWARPSSRARRAPWVPFPDPGRPTMTRWRGAVTSVQPPPVAADRAPSPSVDVVHRGGEAVGGDGLDGVGRDLDRDVEQLALSLGDPAQDVVRSPLLARRLADPDADPQVVLRL